MTQLDLNSFSIRPISSVETVGVCRICDAEFKCYFPSPVHARWELIARFDSHECRQGGA
jgi:hypothetical protein